MPEKVGLRSRVSVVVGAAMRVSTLEINHVFHGDESCFKSNRIEALKYFYGHLVAMRCT